MWDIGIEGGIRLFSEVRTHLIHTFCIRSRSESDLLSAINGIARTGKALTEKSRFTVCVAEENRTTPLGYRILEMIFQCFPGYQY